MADREDFQAQIASILELLAQSAVAQICGLVEEGYAVLRRQVERGEQEKEALRRRLQLVERGEQEKEALRRRLQLMDERMRSCERKMRRRSQRQELVGGTDDHQLQVSPPPSASEEKHLHSLKEEAEVLPLVKQEKTEKDDCSLDLKVEVNIRANCGLPSQEPERENPPEDVLDTSLPSFASSTSQLSPPLTEATVDLTCRSRVKRRSNKLLSCSVVQGPEAACGDLTGSLTDDIHTEDPTDDELCLQMSTPVDSDEPCAERLSNLGLDLAWMQERVSHLGAAYAVAQLGLGNTDTAAPSTAFTRQGGGDSLDGPPAMLFTGGAQEMTAFATSFDMTAVAAAVIAPPPTASSATTITKRQPYRSSTSDKEPAVCTVCRRVLPTATALEQHQRIHTGERPYTCPHCGKGFAQPNNLRVHLLVHTGERRYRCSLCGKSFISSSHLKRHRTVHTQEKPYSCSRCGQSFSQMCSVRRHRQQSQCGL